MPDRVEGNVLMEGVTLVFKNFKGKEGQYNAEGDRNFGVLLEEGLAQQMAEDGWNVKMIQPREDADEGEVAQPFLPVTAEYRKGKPPTIVMITDRGRTHLDVDTVETLDWVDIRHVDLIVRPFNWEVSGKHGVKAYLQTMYVTVEEDELTKKYAEDPGPQ